MRKKIEVLSKDRGSPDSPSTKQLIDLRLQLCQALLREADVKTDMGTKPGLGDWMKKRGELLQDEAEETLALLENAPKPNVAADEADLYVLRGLAYEGEGVLTETFGVAKGLAAMIPMRFVEIGERLAAIEFLEYPDISRAHGIKVQAMVALGRYYFRSPRPIRDLPKTQYWLQEAISESVRNPQRKDNPVNPVIPRLFLMDSWLADGERQKAQAMLKEVNELLKKPLSEFEDYLQDFIGRFATRLRRELA